MDKQTLDETLLKIWNAKDLCEVKKLFADGVVLHSPLGDFQSSHEAQAIIQKWLTALPDLEVTHHQILQEGNLYVVHWSAKGTHRGPFGSIEPKNGLVQYTGCSIYRFESEQIVEYWAFLDLQSLEKQMRA